MRATLALLLLFLPSFASAQVLWQNLSVGMSPSQVAAAQPEAVRPSKPDTLHGGASCDLSIRSIEVGSENYNVCFFFKNQRLVQVTLNALETAYESQFRGVVTLLRAKYGQELSLTRGIVGFEADWKLPNGVNVSVVFINKYGNLLNINYQVRMAADASKL